MNFWYLCLNDIQWLIFHHKPHHKLPTADKWVKRGAIPPPFTFPQRTTAIGKIIYDRVLSVSQTQIQAAIELLQIWLINFYLHIWTQAGLSSPHSDRTRIWGQGKECFKGILTLWKDECVFKMGHLCRRNVCEIIFGNTLFWWCILNVLLTIGYLYVYKQLYVN